MLSQHCVKQSLNVMNVQFSFRLVTEMIQVVAGCRQIFLPRDVSEIQGPGLLNYNRGKF